MICDDKWSYANRYYRWIHRDRVGDRSRLRDHKIDRQTHRYCSHWIGLRENLQETMVFTIKYGAFL